MKGRPPRDGRGLQPRLRQRSEASIKGGPFGPPVDFSGVCRSAAKRARERSDDLRPRLRQRSPPQRASMKLAVRHGPTAHSSGKGYPRPTQARSRDNRLVKLRPEAATWPIGYLLRAPASSEAAADGRALEFCRSRPAELERCPPPDGPFGPVGGLRRRCEQTGTVARLR